MIRTQYQTIAAPLVESQSHETRVGFLQCPDPVRRRGLPAALLIAATLTAPVVTPVEDAIANPGGGFVSTGALPILQYQNLAGPLFIEEPEIVPDSPYAASYPARLARLRALHAAYHPAYVADKFTAPTAATVADLSWASTYPDRHNPPKGLAPRLHPTYVSDRAEAPTVDTSTPLSWAPKYPDRHVYRRPVGLRLPVHEIFAVQVEVPVMSWTGDYLTPPMRARARIQWIGNQPIDVENTISPPAPALSWKSVYPDQVFPRQRSHAALVAQTEWVKYLADVTVTAPAWSWSSVYPDRVLRLVRLGTPQQQAWTSDRFDVPDVVTAPDLAVPVYPDLVWERRPIVRPESVWIPAFVPDVTDPAPARSWAPRYDDAARGRRFPTALQMVWQSSVYIVDVTDPAPALAWLAIYPPWNHRRLYQVTHQDDLTWNTETPTPATVSETFGRGRYTVPPRRRTFIVPSRRRNWTV